MPALTRLTLQYRIGDLIGDPNNQRWTASEVQDKINEGQERFVIDTRCLKDKQLVSVISGTSSYAITNYAIDVDRVTLNSISLSRKSRNELDILYGSASWETDAGTPIHYFVDIDPGEQKVRLVPTPGDGDAGTNNMTIYYDSMPEEMTLDSNIPFNVPAGASASTLLVPYGMAPAYWAAADLLRVQPTQESLVMIKEYEKQYSALVSHCIDSFKSMSESSPRRMLGGRYFKGL